jgi:hypothetical protein
MYEVDIKDVIKNYELKDNEGFLYCLFEAISNSLYCCIDNEKIEITVNFVREYKANAITEDKDNYIKSFSITDNGIGFIDDNFNNFTRYVHKTNHDGGKGLGRISFLKVFENISIKSYFKEKDKSSFRSFVFDSNEIVDTKDSIKEQDNQTIITFSNMKPCFSKSTRYSVDYYCKEILKHFYIFLYYLLEKGKDFEIKLVDDSGKISEQIINAQKLKKDKVKREKFEIKDNLKLDGFDNIVEFEVLHIKTKNIEDNKAFYIVDERSAGEINNLNLPPSVLRDKDNFDYHYYVYLKSGYFKRFLNESRTKLSLPQKDTNGSFITEEKIEGLLKEKIVSFLKYEIELLDKENEEKIKRILTDPKNNKVVNNKAYVQVFEDEKIRKKFLSSVKYKDSERNILSKAREFHEGVQLQTVERITKLVQNLKKDNKDTVDFKKLEEEVTELAAKVTKENSVSLSSYIMFRKYVLNLFKEALNVYKDSGQYNESLFHNLLLPKKTSNNIDSNMWLLDDLFLYFEGTSEQSIEEIKINGNKIIRDLSPEEKELLNEFNQKRLCKRIDLLFFPEEKKCVIIELKDPKVGKVNDSVNQMDKYTELLANFIKEEFSIEQFYTYFITDNFNKFDRPTGYRKIYGVEGFVRNSSDIKSFENDTTIANQYSEVIRYTDIYTRASKRNNIFFKKLGF